ncbi:hypothetical protein L7F22_031372 [Adiantum nelumboides]|nr:hypothetical protein [Adiantum nelumboides]
MHDAEDSSDNQALVGEEEDYEDELLEAEGRELHESDDGERDLADVCIPTWKSGDTMHAVLEGTFKKLPMFVDIASPNMGQIPRELTKIQLLLALFPMGLVDKILHETNCYALEKRECVICKHESTKSWNDLDRHPFLQFLGVSAAMSLQYMPDKTSFEKERHAM